MKEDELCRVCSTNGAEEECVWVLEGKPDGKRQLERPRHKWVDNIKGWGGWTGLIWLRIGTSGGLYVNMVINFRVHKMLGSS
jgi:hypothetical protein